MFDAIAKSFVVDSEEENERPPYKALDSNVQKLAKAENQPRCMIRYINGQLEER